MKLVPATTGVAAGVGVLTILALIAELRQERRILIEEFRHERSTLTSLVEGAVVDENSRLKKQLDAVTARSRRTEARIGSHANRVAPRIADDAAVELPPTAGPPAASTHAGTGSDYGVSTGSDHDVSTHAALAPLPAGDIHDHDPDPDGSECDERGPDGRVQVHCSGPVTGLPPDDPITRELAVQTPLGGHGNYVTASIELTEAVKLHLAKLPPIPKKIHLCWAHNGVLNATYENIELIQRGVGNLTKSNPSWTATVWDDAAMELYIKRHLAPHDYELIKDAYVVEKTDLFRLLLMYHEGGIYQDIDRLYDRGPIESIIRAKTRLLLPWWSDINFSQDIMMSSPGCRVHLNAIRFNLKLRRRFDARKKEQSDIQVESKAESAAEAKQAKNQLTGMLLELGPGAYREAVSYTLFGHRMEQYPKLDDAAHSLAGPTMRKAMEAIPQLQTFDEWGDREECVMTFSYIEKGCFKTWGLKADFLTPQNRKQWVDEMDEMNEI